MGVPHSGISGSLGLADATGIRIDHEGIQKMSNYFKGRSFTAATGSEREIIARSKHHINDKYVKGKVIILGDDSKVRNNAARVLIANLKLAGAKRIIEVIFAPPVREICYMGINHNDKKDLIAANCSLDEIARKSGAEKVIYLDRIDMKSLIESCYGYDNFCDGCFGGSYPV
jgi:amidophosphoribosyltransferase